MTMENTQSRQALGINQSGESSSTLHGGSLSNDTYTMEDVIAEEQELTEIADAVLGDSEESECSFNRGYIRQALYACLTCTPPDSDASAGFCLGCSLNCHQGHDIIELYTKRNFQCDCGNSKFPEEFECQLLPVKSKINEFNIYGQNFKGKYCICHKPYPDADRSTPEVMIQCIMCEDWLHEEHVFPQSTNSETVPDAFDEMICGSCMSKHTYLYTYNVNKDKLIEIKAEINDKDCLLKVLSNKRINTDDKILAKKKGESSTKVISDQSSTDEKEVTKHPKTESHDSTVGNPTFWEDGWRTLLCPCKTCNLKYQKSSVLFLLNTEDSLRAHERNGKRKRETLDSISSASTDSEAAGIPNRIATGTAALNKKFSHTQQIQMAQGYRNMASSLKEYLQDFATSGKVVQAKDIHNFFERLKKQKKN